MQPSAIHRSQLTCDRAGHCPGTPPTPPQFSLCAQFLRGFCSDLIRPNISVSTPCTDLKQGGVKAPVVRFCSGEDVKLNQEKQAALDEPSS